MTTQPVQQTKETPPPIQMLQIISGFWVARCVYVIAKLGIPDLIKDGSRTAEDLAAATGAHASSLFRVLRAMVPFGILTLDESNRFGITPLSETLRSDTAGSLRAFAMTELGEEHYPAWGELLYSVRTGGIAFDHAFGEPCWEFFAKHPENAQIFNDAMSGMTAQANEALHAAYDFAGIKTIMDVGGGHGGLITGILRRNPEMSGILFDSPQVIAARERTEKEFRALYEASGFQLTRVVPTQSPFSVIEGVRV